MSLSTTATLQHADTAVELRNFGRGRLSDYFADFVIYRNLEPLDRRLRGLKSAGYKMGLSSDRIPRKFEPDYAKAAVWFAEEAQKLRHSKAALQEILFVGDTLLNDGQAYHNIVKASGWKGSCFIGADRLKHEPAVEIEEAHLLYNANRWVAIGDWIHWLHEHKFRLDERTLLIVDIDKTALGAKGRNDQVIDRARLEGIYRTMDSVLGDDFDRVAFERQYSELNRARYHGLTEDNQDYLAYICLVLNTGLIGYDDLLSEIENESLKDFEQFLRWVDSRMMATPRIGEGFRQVHEAVVASVRVGDPTPFKQFRREEFRSTAAHMGNMTDSAAVATILNEEITLTQEVCELSAWLKTRGALLLCLSDKPFEASCPTRPNSEYQPLHKTETHCVGTSIQAQLDQVK